jgi:hypothetical protein
MLARLISARQVVLAYDGTGLRLFYQGQVYSRPAAYDFDNLPQGSDTEYCPIWMLIDVDNRNQEPPIPVGLMVWPIQASSPNPARWKAWRKQYNAALLGMPLWDLEELMEGYVFSLFSLSAIDPGHVVR